MSMPNYLTMPKQQQILALLALGWSYGRIEAETGVRRETISRYAQRQAEGPKTRPGRRAARANCGEQVPRRRPAPPTRFRRAWRASRVKSGQSVRRLGVNAATPFLGSPRPRFSATIYREAITEKLDAGLTVQRIWQDLVEEYGYGASYESVKRLVRTIAPKRGARGGFE